MINRSVLFISISLFLSINILAQNEEYKTHLKSIYNSTKPVQDGCFAQDTFFVDYVIRNYLEKPEYIKFISNRNLLKKINVITCYNDFVLMKDTINGTTYEIEIRSEAFDSVGKIIQKYEEEDLNHITKSINGQIPYGSTYGIPEKEITSLTISINGIQVNIPDTAYRNLFEPIFCEFGYFQKSISAYPSIDGRYLYIYIYGSMNAGQYFSKLIFDRNKYITRIAVEYVDLSCYGSFRKDFIGF